MAIGRPHAFRKLRFYPVMIMAFIAVAIIVPLAVAIIISGNIPEESRVQPSNSYVVAVHAERIDDHTIKIINLGGEGKPLLNKDLPFIVLINGKNATNRHSLEEHHLPLTIFPEAGLGYVSGSSVTYAGDDVAAGNSVNVQIFGNYKGGIVQNMLNITLV